MGQTQKKHYVSSKQITGNSTLATVNVPEKAAITVLSAVKDALQGPSEMDLANLDSKAIASLTDIASVSRYIGLAAVKGDNVAIGLLNARLQSLLSDGAKAVSDKAEKSEAERALEEREGFKKDFISLVSQWGKTHADDLVRHFTLLGKTEAGKQKGTESAFALSIPVESGKDFFTVSIDCTVMDKVPIRSLSPEARARVKARRAEKERDALIQAEWNAYMREQGE